MGRRYTRFCRAGGSTGRGEYRTPADGNAAITEQTDCPDGCAVLKWRRLGRTRTIDSSLSGTLE